MRAELERRLSVVVEPVERAVLDGVREFENEPDRVRLELGIIPVFADERPLVGLAGLLDWRACGRLSALLRSGFFRGELGERLLTLGERRWPVDRLVLVGVGPQASFDEAQAREFGARCIEIAAGLDAGSVVVALPSAMVERGTVELAFEALLDALGRHDAELEAAAARASLGGSEPEPEPKPEPKPEPEPERQGGRGDAGPSSREASETGPASEVVAEPGDRGGNPGGRDEDPGGADGPERDSEASAGPQAPGPTPTDASPITSSGGSPGGSPGRSEAAQDSQAAPPEPAQAAAEAPVEPAQLHLWVVADEAVVARLRRVRSGPPRAARPGPGLHT